MELVKKNKARTAITIDPDLWERAKEACAQMSRTEMKRVSFSSLVELALDLFLCTDTEEDSE